MSFGQNITLLLLTASLTGLLVPTIKGLMDDRRFRQQKRFEAEIARESAIIEAQVRLLDDLSTLLWEFVLSMISVSYYVVNSDPTRAEAAFEDYSDKASDRFGRTQAELSKANRLVPSKRVREFQELYRMLLDLDKQLLSLANSGLSPSQAWWQHHDMAFGVQGPLATALANLAADMQLAAVEPSSIQGPIGDARVSMGR